MLGKNLHSRLCEVHLKMSTIAKCKKQPFAQALLLCGGEGGSNAVLINKSSVFTFRVLFGLDRNFIFTPQPKVNFYVHLTSIFAMIDFQLYALGLSISKSKFDIAWHAAKFSESFNNIDWRGLYTYCQL